MRRSDQAPKAPHKRPPWRRWQPLAPWFSTLTLTFSLLLGCGGLEYGTPLPASPAQEAEAGEGWAAAPAPSPAVPSLPEAVLDAPQDGADVTRAQATEDTQDPGSAMGEPVADAEPANSARLERLIYNAYLRVATAEPEAAASQLADWARQQGGYVLSQRGQTLELRVPSKRFSDSVTQAAKLGELIDRRVEVQDVTEQYFDLETRIANAEALQARLRGLLERSTVVKDALAIERELARVSADLEVLKGKMRRLRELVTYSTITVEWVELEAEQVQTTARLPFPWLGTLGLSHLLEMEDQ